MFEEENQFKDNVFKKNHLNDPFRESNMLFEDLENLEDRPLQEVQSSPEPEAPATKPEGQSFKLHLHETKIDKKEDLPPLGKVEEKRTLKDVFRDASRQVVASAIILVLGFFLLNWSAYYQIAKTKLENLTGKNANSPLVQLVEENYNSNSKLNTSADPEIQKRQIPTLAMEIAPPDNRIIIPGINQNIPIVNVSSESLIKKDWAALEAEMQDALKGGVVHYPGTSLPGQGGNSAITGHSSYFPWDPGRFKDVFALLHEVKIGDKILIYQDQKKYIYQIEEKFEVKPDNLDILKQSPEEKLTLITCTPVGTNLRRLIVVAKPVIVESANKISR